MRPRRSAVASASRLRDRPRVEPTHRWVVPTPLLEPGWRSPRAVGKARWGQPGAHLASSQPVPLAPRRAVRALCDHTAAGPDQLSFRRGEVLRVVATVDEDWLRCGRNGVEGLVPVGYTSLVL